MFMVIFIRNTSHNQYMVMKPRFVWEEVCEGYDDGAVDFDEVAIKVDEAHEA